MQLPEVKIHFDEVFFINVEIQLNLTRNEVKRTSKSAYQSRVNIKINMNM